MSDLTITIAGLCLLVPDQTGGAMHVLMPKVGGHVHFPALVFLDKNGGVQKEIIDGLDLAFLNVSGSNGFKPDLPINVFDFGDSVLGKRTVRSEVLQSAALPGQVRTRARLTTGTHARTPRHGGFWNFEVQNTHVPRRMPTAVNWSVRNVNSTPVVIEDRRAAKIFELFPGNDGSIRALLVHVTPEEFSRIVDVVLPEQDGCPPPEHPATHFELFYPLLTPNGAAPVPKFDHMLSHAAGVCPPRSETTSAATAQRSAAAAAASAAAAAAAVAAAAALNPAAPAALAAAASAAAASAAAVAAEAAVAIPSAVADRAPAGTAAAHGDHGALGAHGAHFAAASAGSDLTCMVTTAPPPG